MTLAPLSLKVAGKSKINGKNDTKCLKNAVKTAKKPILREKCAATVASQSASQASKRSRIANFGDCAHYWTADEQLAAASKGGKVKALRRAILDDCARTAAKENRIAKLFDEALNEPDPEIANQKMQLAERAAKFIGATHDQSDEAKQKIELAGKLDNKLEVEIKGV